MREPQAVQFGDRVLDPFAPAIGDVIACKRHGVEPGAPQSGQVRRIRARRRHVAGKLHAAPRVRHFQVADDDIAGTQRGPDAGQPVIRFRYVQHQIAGQHDAKRIL